MCVYIVWCVCVCVSEFFTGWRDLQGFIFVTKRLESNLKAISEVLSRWELKVNWKTKVTRVVGQKGHCEVRIGDV